MDIDDLKVFLAVVAEQSFSRAAWRLQRSQPVVSLTVRRIEKEVGEALFDRSSKGGTLTEAGRVFRHYADQVVRLADQANTSVRELRDLRRGRVVIGANEGAVHSLLPLIERFTSEYPQILVDVRRTPARDVVVEVVQGSLDCGITTFKPNERRLRSIPIADDEMVAVVYPDHPFARRTKVTLAEWARQPIIVHSDPSPARDRVFRQVEQRHADFYTRIALPTLEGIKRAVEMRLGISLLPRRCATAELESGRLVAVQLPELRMPRKVRLLYRRHGANSHAATAFIRMVADLRQKQPRRARLVAELPTAAAPMRPDSVVAGSFRRARASRLQAQRREPPV